MAISIVQAQATDNRTQNRLIRQAVNYRWLGSTLLKCGQICSHANCKARILEGEWGHSNSRWMGPQHLQSSRLTHYPDGENRVLLHRASCHPAGRSYHEEPRQFSVAINSGLDKGLR